MGAVCKAVVLCVLERLVGVYSKRDGFCEESRIGVYWSLNLSCYFIVFKNFCYKYKVVFYLKLSCIF